MDGRGRGHLRAKWHRGLRPYVETTLKDQIHIIVAEPDTLQGERDAHESLGAELDLCGELGDPNADARADLPGAEQNALMNVRGRPVVI